MTKMKSRYLVMMFVAMVGIQIFAFYYFYGHGWTLPGVLRSARIFIGSLFFVAAAIYFAILRNFTSPRLGSVRVSRTAFYALFVSFLCSFIGACIVYKIYKIFYL